MFSSKTAIASVSAAAVLAAGVPAAASAAAPAATPLQKVSAAVQPGIVYLQTTFEAQVVDPKFGTIGGTSGKTFTVGYRCTGFFVTPKGDIGSAGHCVDYDAQTKADLLAEAGRWSFANERWEPGTTEEDAIAIAQANWRLRTPGYVGGSRPTRKVKASYGTQVAGQPSNKTLPARVLGSKSMENGDVALLSIDVTGEVPTLPLASGELSVGTPVVTVGFPGTVDTVTDETFDPSFKEGTVSSKKTVDDGHHGVVEVSAAISQGMSGGPAVDLQGRVVGINSFKPAEESQAFNFISPVKELVGLLRDKGVTPRQSESDRLYRDGLAAYFAGNREDAVEHLDALLERVANHGLAQTYRTRALKLAAAPKAGSPVGLIVGGAVLVLTLALAGVAVLRRRRIADEAPTPAPDAPQPARREAAPQPQRVTAERTVLTEVPAPLVAASLHLTTGPRAGERLPVGRELTVGRGADAGLRLDDAQVSRTHARLLSAPEGLRVEDLGSSNGTKVNGERVDGAVDLEHGDELTIGTTTITVELDDALRARQATRLVTA